MDIFIRNLPYDTTTKRLRKALRPHLERYGITVFDCAKHLKGSGLLSILSREAGGRLLHDAQYGTFKIFVGSRPAHLQPSRQAMTEYKLRALQKKAQDQQKQGLNTLVEVPVFSHEPGQVDREFQGHHLAIGSWDYLENGNLCFVPELSDRRPFQLRCGKYAMALLVRDGTHAAISRMDIDYSAIQYIVYRQEYGDELVLCLWHAPKTYEVPQNSIVYANFKSSRQSQNPAKPRRVVGMNPEHAAVMGCCYVYRLDLLAGELHAIKALARRQKAIPPIEPWPFSFDGSLQRPPLISTMRALENCLASLLSEIGFGVAFQCQRLAQNGYLHPKRVTALLPAIKVYVEVHGNEQTIDALRRLASDLPYAGPESAAESFRIEELEASLRRKDSKVNGKTSSGFRIARRHRHVVMIHRARVTPAGIQLDGPDPEPWNHVIRMMNSWALDHLLRVTFEDENGNALCWDPVASLEQIHFGRFKEILEGSIYIAGRFFRFLGFSSSSLRTQACWFMSPFTDRNGVQVAASTLIANLGDFSHIRTPARCAARIGQNFTDLTSFVELPKTAVQRVADIERNGRCFSDGCSAISLSLLQKVWANGYRRFSTKPTLFQMRIGGAKGMISLSSRLEGDVIQLRKSQIKFEASDSTRLGICRGANKSLPFYLNRQLVKVLEDLGVSAAAFEALQQEHVLQLRASAASAVNAAHLLSHNDVAKVLNLAWLLEELQVLNLPGLEDRFLGSVVEMALLANLRELKHRARIPVKQAATLYGVMDEFNELDEGEIYCCIHDTQIIQGKVTITRSPALHPGDVQHAYAVEPPEDSPLRNLRNCVVFSQRGPRDLPSQLSGGDLDGDLFNVIFDDRLLPTMIVQAADYPRIQPVDIGRSVEQIDMSNFFLQYMANNQLGRIANLHLILADRHADGVFNPECLHLAALHSDAVDFAKTGLPESAAIDTMPRNPKERPEFLADGPRAKVERDMSYFDEEPPSDDEDDLVASLDPERRQMRYYESNKALGRLFRQIDERRFLQEFQSTCRSSSKQGPSILEQLWHQISVRVQGFQWKHLIPWAEAVMEDYEASLSDLAVSFSPDPHRPLLEVEVVTGALLGKDGHGPSKRARDSVMTMRERYDELVNYVQEWIIIGDDESVHEQPLERSLACLHVGIASQTQRDAAAAVKATTRKKTGLNSHSRACRTLPRDQLRSFAYLAAVVCLRQTHHLDRSNGVPTSVPSDLFPEYL